MHRIGNNYLIAFQRTIGGWNTNTDFLPRKASKRMTYTHLDLRINQVHLSEIGYGSQNESGCRGKPSGVKLRQRRPRKSRGAILHTRGNPLGLSSSYFMGAKISEGLRIAASFGQDAPLLAFVRSAPAPNHPNERDFLRKTRSFACPSCRL